MARMRLDHLVAFPDGRVLRFGGLRVEDLNEQAELIRRYGAWVSEAADLHLQAAELCIASGAHTLSEVGTAGAANLDTAIAAHEAREPFRPQSLDDLIEQVQREHPDADADTLTRALFEDHADGVRPFAEALGQEALLMIERHQSIDHRIENRAGYVYVGDTRIGWCAGQLGEAGHLWPVLFWAVPTDDQVRWAWEALVATAVPSFAGEYDGDRHYDPAGPRDRVLREMLGQDVPPAQ